MAEGRVLIQRFLKRVAFWTILGGVFTVCISYLCDLAIFRWKHSPTGTVIITPYYAVPQKNHSVEYMADDPREQTCANSLYPHSGLSPCWYLNRHRDQRIDM